MKRIFIIATLLLVAVSSFAQSGKKIYEKYSDNKNVSAVYISPAMFRMIGAIPDLKTSTGDVNLANIISSLSGMYILSTSNSQIKGSLNNEVNSFISSNKFELLMEAKEDGEAMRMYTMGEGDIVEGFVMLASDAEEVSFICIEGKMSRADLEKTIAQEVNNKNKKKK